MRSCLSESCLTETSSGITIIKLEGIESIIRMTKFQYPSTARVHTQERPSREMDAIDYEKKKDSVLHETAWWG